MMPIFLQSYFRLARCPNCVLPWKWQIKIFNVNDFFRQIWEKGAVAMNDLLSICFDTMLDVGSKLIALPLFSTEEEA